MNYDITLTFITPLFLHGADFNAAEFRASSVRGQLREWFRLCGGTADQEQSVFGGLHGGSRRRDPVASRVVVRIGKHMGNPTQMATLPHHNGKLSAVKEALIRANCQLLISSRNGDLPSADNKLFHRALKAWLLMGAIGQRATRGGGNFTWEWDSFPMPSSPEKYQAACQEVLEGTQVKAALLKTDHPITSESEARKIITNTIGGPFPDTHTERQDLADIRHPLGYVSEKSRKVSSLRFRVCKLENQFYILAVWDGRENVTGNRPSDLHDVIDLLADHRPEPKRIGQLLRESSLYSNPT